MSTSAPPPRPTNRSSLLLGIVGKPSAGKSTLLNAISPKSKAEMHERPFTTINPNRGQATYQRPCLCKKYNLTEKCSPRHGSCENGVRNIPVDILDVAGLIPGASEGLGLGNQFLNDLTQADVLIHVVDVSGTTNEKGEVTENYDAWEDVKWLEEEIHAWIFGNVWSKWGPLMRKHILRKVTIVETLNSILSGYGASKAFIHYVVSETKCESEEFYKRYAPTSDAEDISLGDEKASQVTNYKVDQWKESHVRAFLRLFMNYRFPTVLAMNKCDKQTKCTNRNIMKIYEMYPNDMIVPVSALSELVLQQMAKKKIIEYRSGDSSFTTREDDPSLTHLSMPNDSQKATLEKIREIVLDNYDSTGTVQLVKESVELRDPVLVCWVNDVKKFTSRDSSPDQLFHDCALVRKRTSVGAFFHLYVKSGSDETLAYCEGEDGRRIAEHAPIMEDCVLKFVLEKK